MHTVSNGSTRRELHHLRIQLQTQMNEIKAKLQAVEMTLAMLAGKPTITNLAILPDLRGLTQKQALRALAEANRGIVKTREAKDQMVHAGLIKGKSRP